MALPFYCCQTLLSKLYCIFSQILSIDQTQRKPCFCLVSAQLKPFAAVLRDRQPQFFKTFHIYTVTSLWHAKLLKISAFTPWGSAARLEGMKSLRIHNLFLWNAKNKAVNSHKAQRQALQGEGGERTLEMEARRDEPYNIISASTQAERHAPHDFVLSHCQPLHHYSILPKQLWIDSGYLNVNLHFFVS